MRPDQRAQSRGLLLETIRRADHIARIDLAQATGISRATVTAITADLIREGLIEEIARDSDDGEAPRGRPRVALRLRGAAHLVAGLKIADKAISVVIADFEGHPLASHSHRVPAPSHSPDAFAHHVAQALDAALAQAKLARGDLSAVGIGLAGVIDAPRGHVHWSPLLTARNFALADHLGAALRLPTHIDNDANLVALAEMYFGTARHARDFLVVTVEAGVGLGIVLGGALYRGTRGCGAEFGHTKVAADGAACRCGQRGCLEAYVADDALLRAHPAPDLASLLGDPAAAGVIAQARQYFALGLANLVNIFDPELIILSGAGMQFDHLFTEQVIEDMRRQIVQIDTPPPQVVLHRWGDDMWARGAAAYAISRVCETALAQGRAA